ncbi:hypothetical protein HMI54_008926 [Coelomomyces lativittatus]|nr:hypothetical protein HMI54_008926 [Coelomomyces lativittatus]KAJ1503985.1 hypothetical protein HMI56_001853 [Coelomomyces lativittatus]
MLALRNIPKPTTPTSTFVVPKALSPRTYPLRKRLLLQEYRQVLTQATLVVIAKVPDLPTSIWNSLRASVHPFQYHVKCLHNLIFHLAGFPHVLHGSHVMIYTLPHHPDQATVEEHPERLQRVLQVLPKSVQLVYGQLPASSLPTSPFGAPSSLYRDSTLWSPEKIKWYASLPTLPHVQSQLLQTLHQDFLGGIPFTLMSPMHALVMYLQMRRDPKNP